MTEPSPAPSRNDLILDLYADCKSVEEISRAVHALYGNYVGTSEINAVVHRAKQVNDQRAMRPPSKKGRGQTSFNNVAFGRRGPRKPPRVPDLLIGEAKAFAATAVVITKARDRQCRFPLNDDKTRLVVCGAGTTGKFSYCAFHLSICYEAKS